MRIGLLILDLDLDKNNNYNNKYYIMRNKLVKA